MILAGIEMELFQGLKLSLQKLKHWITVSMWYMLACCQSFFVYFLNSCFKRHCSCVLNCVCFKIAKQMQYFIFINTFPLFFFFAIYLLLEYSSLSRRTNQPWPGWWRLMPRHNATNSSRRPIRTRTDSWAEQKSKRFSSSPASRSSFWLAFGGYFFPSNPLQLWLICQQVDHVESTSLSCWINKFIVINLSIPGVSATQRIWVNWIETSLHWPCTSSSRKSKELRFLQNSLQKWCLHLRGGIRSGWVVELLPLLSCYRVVVV